MSIEGKLLTIQDRARQTKWLQNTYKKDKLSIETKLLTIKDRARQTNKTDKKVGQTENRKKPETKQSCFFPRRLLE